MDFSFIGKRHYRKLFCRGKARVFANSSSELRTGTFPTSISNRICARQLPVAAVLPLMLRRGTESPVFCHYNIIISQVFKSWAATASRPKAAVLIYWIDYIAP
jgi:hypothetical protein